VEQGVIMSKRAVLMMTFGSPEEITYEGVAEFFTNIRRGVRPEPHEIQTLYDHYLRIGGTPLQRITKKEVDLVASALGEQVSVYFANKFSRPFIIDAVKEMFLQAEIYVFETEDMMEEIFDETGGILGFIGLDKDYVEGIFVRGDVRSQSIQSWAMKNF
jgi:hypothetical protein